MGLDVYKTTKETRSLRPVRKRLDLDMHPEKEIRDIKKTTRKGNTLPKSGEM